MNPANTSRSSRSHQAERADEPSAAGPSSEAFWNAPSAAVPEQRVFVTVNNVYTANPSAARPEPERARQRPFPITARDIPQPDRVVPAPSGGHVPGFSMILDAARYVEADQSPPPKPKRRRVETGRRAAILSSVQSGPSNPVGSVAHGSGLTDDGASAGDMARTAAASRTGPTPPAAVIDLTESPEGSRPALPISRLLRSPSPAIVPKVALSLAPASPAMPGKGKARAEGEAKVGQRPAPQPSSRRSPTPEIVENFTFRIPEATMRSGRAISLRLNLRIEAAGGVPATGRAASEASEIIIAQPIRPALVKTARSRSQRWEYTSDVDPYEQAVDDMIAYGAALCPSDHQARAERILRRRISGMRNDRLDALRPLIRHLEDVPDRIAALDDIARGGRV